MTLTFDLRGHCDLCHLSNKNPYIEARSVNACVDMFLVLFFNEVIYLILCQVYVSIIFNTADFINSMAFPSLETGDFIDKTSLITPTQTPNGSRMWSLDSQHLDPQHIFSDVTYFRYLSCDATLTY